MPSFSTLKVFIAVVFALVAMRIECPGQSRSLALNPDAPLSYQIPNRPPFNPAGEVRVEFRIHGFSEVSAGGVAIYSFNHFTATFVPNAQRFHFTNWIDKLQGGGTSFVIDWSDFNNDIVGRFQRDPQNRQMSIELWNADGSKYLVRTAKLAELGAARLDGNFQIGGKAGFNYSFLRLYSNVVALGTPPSTLPGDLGNWDFDGDLTDSSGNQLSMSLAGTPVEALFLESPKLPPNPVTGPDRTVRAGFPFTLDGSGSWSADGSVEQRSWQLIEGPSSVTLTNPTSAVTNVKGAIFGTYKFRLAAFNNNGTSYKQILVGAVATDDNNVVIPSDPNVTFMFGPMLMHGTSPWPHLDERQQFMADFFGELQDTDPTYADTWSTALSGTISVTNGSKAVAGTGTSFQADFCGGGTSPIPADQSLVVWFPDGSGGFAKRDYPIASCSSATVITLSLAYAATLGTEPTLNYSKLAYIGNWAGGSDNNNYYDVVMALYSMYYRSGLTKYRDYARTLAQRWWTSPRIDKMNVCMVGLDKGPRCTPSRVRALTGIAWWLYEAGDPLGDGWDKLYAFLDAQVAGIVATSNIPDIRESAYDIAHMAVAAKLGPNSTKNATYAATLSTAITNRWGPQQQANGEWTNQTYGCSSWNGFFGTITVTKGSPIVTGSGTNWSNGCSSGITGLPFWAPQDTVAYRVVSLDSPTQVTLDRPYAGTTRSGIGWQFYNLVGRGTQPFMMGVIGRAWNYTYQLTGNQQARQFVIDAADWIANYGINISRKGLYYARVFPNCEPNPDSSGFCAGTGRFLQAEVGAALAAGYLYVPHQALRSRADELTGAMLGQLGGPETDGESAGEFATADITAYKKAKNFGFPFGFGGTQSWAAARLGEAQTGQLEQIPLPPIPLGKIRLLAWVIQPNGTRVLCSSSCTADRSLGEPWIVPLYLDIRDNFLSTAPMLWTWP